jgi:hypothetical protein
MTNYKCPECGEPIGDTGISSTVNDSSLRQSATCPSCHTKLVRNPESAVPKLRDWRTREKEVDAEV